MGNCQTIDSASLVIQHPNGKLERMYWTVTVREVMKTNPGHYVSLIIPLPISGEISGQGEDYSGDSKTTRFTRLKLLRPTEILSLGHAYRLLTTQQVVKVLKAKKHAKMNKNQTESVHFEVISEKRINSYKSEAGKSASEKNDKKPEKKRDERNRQNMWRPSLQSISES